MNRNTAALVAAFTAALAAAQADERFFTYIEDADVVPKGEWEFEQWVTYGQGLDEGNSQVDLYQWSFREELEYGLTEKLSASLYINFQQASTEAHAPGLEDTSDLTFQGFSGELKYQLLSPVTDPVGLALYVEPTFSNDEVELEEKVILSKYLGDHWVLAANASLEQEWDWKDEDTEKESVLEFSVGAAYRLTSHWSLGVETRYHAVYEGLGWEERVASAWFAGPNLHYGASRWWATLTGLPQISGNPATEGYSRELDEHMKFEIRLLVGVNF